MITRNDILFAGPIICDTYIMHYEIVKYYRDDIDRCRTPSRWEKITAFNKAEAIFQNEKAMFRPWKRSNVSRVSCAY